MRIRGCELWRETEEKNEHEVSERKRERGREGDRDECVEVARERGMWGRVGRIKMEAISYVYF